MTETAKRFNVRLEKLPTPTEARLTYSNIAAEALKGVSVFEQMDEIGKEHITDDTAYVIAITLYKYGGHLLRTSPDVAWSGLNQAHSTKKATQNSSFGRFKTTLDDVVARRVYGIVFAMLESGVKTREELDAIRNGPPDVLAGMRDSLRRAPEII